MTAPERQADLNLSARRLAELCAGGQEDFLQRLAVQLLLFQAGRDLAGGRDDKRVDPHRLAFQDLGGGAEASLCGPEIENGNASWSEYVRKRSLCPETEASQHLENERNRSHPV